MSSNNPNSLMYLPPSFSPHLVFEKKCSVLPICIGLSFCLLPPSLLYAQIKSFKQTEHSLFQSIQKHPSLSLITAVNAFFVEALLAGCFL
jgi:hypothetical protein